ncbi:short chain isoprenyl diphosphate synthase IdsA [Actimicrobium antarcticum]|uniref:Short chain isoprenyl diphosphate synthase IdsA n=1 Tax=Actimicrobium antarcticum TaxID=1051899 RepID=A0ABP7U0W3_9BURK
MQVSVALSDVEAMMLASLRANASEVSRKTAGAREAAQYHLSAGGQRIRANIALHAGLSAGLNAADATIIAAAVELLHNASLVHDDIQDRDELRRGQQAVWSRFGVNTAICTGDLFISAAYATLCRLDNARVLAPMILLMHERVSMAVDGQCADLQESAAIFSDTKKAIAHYQQIAVAKSGALLSLPLELVLLASGQPDYLPQARSAAEAFAIGYQIADDLQDVQSDGRAGTAAVGYNIVSVFKATGTTALSMEKARTLGLEKIDLAIALSGRLPFSIGARLGDYARQLRDVVDGYKSEEQIGGNE